MFQTVIQFNRKSPPPPGVSPGGFLESGARGAATEQLPRAHSNGVDQHYEEKCGAATMGSESKLRLRSGLYPKLEDNSKEHNNTLTH